MGLPIERDLPADFINDIKSKRLILFVGAGISKKSGLPLWNELIEIILRQITDNFPDIGNSLSKHFENDSSEKKIFNILSKIDSTTFKPIITKVLNERIYEKGKRLIETNNLNIQDSLWNISNKIITPNYDLLLESSSFFSNSSHSLITNKSILSLHSVQQDDKFLFKIHGTVQTGIDSLIFFESQYKEQYDKYKNDSAASTALKTLISGSPILFLGTSMTDPYINKIINDVSDIFQNSSPQNYWFTNELVSNPAITKIQGDPILDIDIFLTDLINLTGKKRKTQKKQLPRPKEMKTLDEAVYYIKHNNTLFPDLPDFLNDLIELNSSFYKIIISRFQKNEGPLLIQGRFDTGKTTSIIRFGFEAQKNGYSVFYLELDNDTEDSYQKENFYIEKILKPFCSENVIFIVDNAHVSPSLTYKLASWSIKEKRNIIFISRPISKDFTDINFFPYLFKGNVLEITDNYEEDEEEGQKNIREFALSEFELIPETSILVLNAPDFEVFKKIFLYYLKKKNIDSIIDDLSLIDFLDKIGYNLSYIVLHLHNLNNISALYEINEKNVYSFLNNKYKFTQYPEVLTIAALSLLDCKVHLPSLIKPGFRSSSFLSEQKFLKHKEGYIFGISPAEAKLLINISWKIGLIKSKAPEPLDFYRTVSLLIKGYMRKKPLNIFDIFGGLVNFETELRENSETPNSQEIRETIHVLLSQSYYLDFYSNIIIPSTTSFLHLGYFAKLYRVYAIDSEIVKKCFSQAALSECVKLSVVNNNRRGLLARNRWYLKYAWKNLFKTDITLGERFISNFSYDYLVKYVNNSVKGITDLLEIGLAHDYIRTFINDNFKLLIGKPDSFINKLSATREIGFYFFIHFSFTYSTEISNGRFIFEEVKRLVTPSFFKKYLLTHKSNLLLVIKTARKFLGESYLAEVITSLDKQSIYSVYFDKPLEQINVAYSVRAWEDFLTTDLLQKINSSSLYQIQKFLRNIIFFGFTDIHRQKLIQFLNRDESKNIFLNKINYSYSHRDVFRTLWTLKSLDPLLLNEYLPDIIKEKNIDPPFLLSVYPIELIIKFNILLSCYCITIEYNVLPSKGDIQQFLLSYKEDLSIQDKIGLASFCFIEDFQVEVRLKSRDLPKFLHFVDWYAANSAYINDNDYILESTTPIVRESYIIITCSTIIGILILSNSIEHNKKFEILLRYIVTDVKELVYQITISIKNPEFIQIYEQQKNKIRILNKTIELVDNYFSL